MNRLARARWVRGVTGLALIALTTSAAWANNRTGGPKRSDAVPRHKGYGGNGFYVPIAPLPKIMVERLLELRRTSGFRGGYPLHWHRGSQEKHSNYREVRKFLSLPELWATVEQLATGALGEPVQVTRLKLNHAATIYHKDQPIWHLDSDREFNAVFPLELNATGTIYRLENDTVAVSPGASLHSNLMPHSEGDGFRLSAWLDPVNGDRALFTWQRRQLRLDAGKLAWRPLREKKGPDYRQMDLDGLDFLLQLYGDLPESPEYRAAKFWASEKAARPQ